MEPTHDHVSTKYSLKEFFGVDRNFIDPRYSRLLFNLDKLLDYGKME